MNEKNKSYLIKILLGFLALIVIFGLIDGRFDTLHKYKFELLIPALMFPAVGIISVLIYYFKNRKDDD